MAPARTLREAFQAADVRPLASGDPYFVDLSEARDTRATVKLKQTIENCQPDRFTAIAFSGHRGSGKSTELRRLEKQVEQSCFTLYLDVIEFLDPLDVDYTDLFLLVSRRLLEALLAQNVHLSADLLKAVEGWFTSVTKETQETVELAAGISTTAQAGAQIPFLARLLAKLTADAKVGSSQKVTTRQELDRYFSGLLSNTDTLLTAAADALHKAQKPSKILILVDNLDRIPPDKSETLFFAHGSQLQAFACHAVYTVSLDTYYSRRGLPSVFPHNEILPNVKLRIGKLDRKENTKAVLALEEVIKRRIDVDLLMQPPELAREIIRLSGGSMHQLIRLLGEAVLTAQARNLTAIDHQALQEAARKLQQEYQRMLAPSDYDLLARVGETKQIEKAPEYMQLLSNRAVLEYNGEEYWQDVNPVIEPIDAYQAARKRRAPALQT